MYPPSPSTPTNPRSRTSGAAPNTSAQYGVPTPGAPFMSTRPLPPSPSTPTHPVVHGHAYGAFPQTPHMGNVHLPMHMPAYGLYTPPASPDKRPQNSDIHPCLREGSPTLMYWDMRTDFRTIRLPHGVTMQSWASEPSAQCIQITAFMGAVNFTVQNSGGVTFMDVFSQILRYMHQLGPSGTSAIQALRNQVLFGGLTPTAPGVYALITRSA